MIPGFSAVPSMVCVLPAPVAPYAKTVELNPSHTYAQRPLVVSWKTRSVCSFSSKAKSNAYRFSLLLFLRSSFFTGSSSKSYGSLKITSFSSRIFTIAMCYCSRSWLHKGLSRTATIILLGPACFTGSWDWRGPPLRLESRYSSCIIIILNN